MERVDENGTRWRPVVGFPRYEVSETGVVRNTRTDRIMSIFPQPKTGQKIVGLVKDGGAGQAPMPLARVVCMAFHGVPAGYVEGAMRLPRVGFLDGDINNCNASNVRWAVVPKEKVGGEVKRSAHRIVGAVQVEELLRVVKTCTCEVLDLEVVAEKTGVDIHQLSRLLRLMGYTSVKSGTLMRFPDGAGASESIEGAGENLNEGGV